MYLKFRSYNSVLRYFFSVDSFAFRSLRFSSSACFLDASHSLRFQFIFSYFCLSIFSSYDYYFKNETHTQLYVLKQNYIFCSNNQQSLCSEMAEELRFAVKCRASRQRPALRRQCSKCIPNANTYVPTNMEMLPQENGIMQMLDIHRKGPSPVHFDCGECNHH